MRARWKLLGGAGLAGIGLAFFVGQSRVSRGDTTSTTTTTSAPPTAPGSQPPFEEPHRQHPFEKYDLGPGAIPYSQLDAVGKAAVDRTTQTVELGQPPASVAAFAAASGQAVIDAQAQIAARSVGLVGTTQDGVVP